MRAQKYSKRSRSRMDLPQACSASSALYRYATQSALGTTVQAADTTRFGTSVDLKALLRHDLAEPLTATGCDRRGSQQGKGMGLTEGCGLADPTTDSTLLNLTVILISSVGAIIVLARMPLVRQDSVRPHVYVDSIGTSTSGCLPRRLETISKRLGRGMICITWLCKRE
jgi:hypothetical protein